MKTINNILLQLCIHVQSDSREYRLYIYICVYAVNYSGLLIYVGILILHASYLFNVVGQWMQERH